MSLTANQRMARLQMDAMDDDELENQRLKIERAAVRIRRTSLYGGGARAVIPKLRTSTITHAGEVPSSMLFSPFKINDLPHTGGDGITKRMPLTSSIPPGAHDDQFRVVTNPTTKSLNDPDRIFLNSSSMRDGIIVVPGGQPPWYYGNNNKTKPPDGNYATMAAGRYGFRGSKDIRQRHTEPYERPTNTKTEHMPRFLRESVDVPDEWVPPIVAATFNTLNGLETPKLWPENTEFATGYPLKRLPSSYKYKRETTVDQEERPRTSHATTMIIDRTAEHDMLHEYSKKERRGVFLSKAVQDKADFDANWSKQLTQDATATLSQSMKRDIPPYQAHTLSDPSDVISYSSASAFIVHTKSNEEMVFRKRMERGLSNIPWAQRWKMVQYHATRIRNQDKRNLDTFQVVADMAVALRLRALKAGTPTTLARLDFMQAAATLKQFEGCEERVLSSLYGAFDHTKRNLVPLVDILMTFAILVAEKESTESKLGRLWDLVENYGNDKSQFEKALACLMAVCASDTDREQTVEYFKSFFRPACYRRSVLVGKGDGASAFASSASGPGSSDEEKGGEAPPSPKKVPGLSVQPAYNITDNFLSKDSFLSIAKDCTMVWGLFDKLLGQRLIDHFGSDTRASSRELELDKLRSRKARFKWMQKEGA